MKFVVNPSYKHSPDLIKTFNKYKESIWFKDHTQYTNTLITDTIKVIDECRRLELSSKYILWLTEHMYKNKLTFRLVKEGYIPLLRIHFYNQDALRPIHAYSSISELNIDIQSLGKESELTSEKELDIFFEKDGWFLAMPHTTKASCLLGKNTDWCTARTKSQNLFLNYVGGVEEDNILFYLIRIDGNSKKNPNDKLSIGFKDGIPIFGGESCTITVNASNECISIEEFGEILGKELAKEMLVKMDEKAQSIKGKHPAKKEMQRISKSVDKYLKKISKFENEDDFSAFRREIAKYNLSKEMQIILSDDKDKDVRAILAQNPNLFESVQIKLANDDEYVRKFVALNPSVTESLQFKLADDESEWVRRYLAGNPNLIESLQLKLADDKDEEVREWLAQNHNLVEFLQYKLANDENEWVRRYLAENPNIIESVQLKLASDKNEKVREALAKNPNLSKTFKIY
jgi:hypothetical protein